MSNAPIVKSTGINLNPKRPDYHGLSWDKDSLAVIANDAGGHGVVLWTVGAHLNYEMSEGGCKYLDDLGLNDAPQGISIWEGKYVWFPDSYAYADDGSTEPKGHFRKPADEEWQAIREGRCPWDEKDWRSGTPCKRCDGEGTCKCPECDGLGVVP